MLEKVKLALRINHGKLDSDIEDTIEAARAEMVRAGISQKKTTDSEDKLITQAIKTYCKWQHSNDQKLAEGYEKSWLYQLDNLRKSSGYRAKEGELDV